ncbi:MAG: 3-deoxy-D-manno-octulosonic acid transferase [Elusimicrobiota bacterium]|jgi:3-deoxy-D-manno-octulosonic-acid transferase
MRLLVYQLIYPFVALLILLKLAWSGRARALDETRADVLERLGVVTPPEDDGRPLLWVHAASVGETLSAAPLLKALSERPERARVLMTCSTATGRAKARALPGVDAAALAPADFLPCVALFLLRSRPRVLVLVESELWPMTLCAAAWSGARMGVVNGRITARAHRRYLALRGLFTSLLRRFERVAAQSEADAARFRALGVAPEALRSCGNMKYDGAPASEEARAAAAGIFARLGWTGAPVWVAGSTRPGEEKVLLDAHREAAGRRPALRLVLAPRHPERCGEAAGLLEAAGIPYVRWSELGEGPGAAPEGVGCLLVDRLGVLGGLYSWALASFVGGTLVPVGGHNLLEPARLGSPVLFGPHTEGIPEPAEMLVKTGGGCVVRSSGELAAKLEEWLESPVRRAVAGQGAKLAAEQFSGATQRTLEHLEPLLSIKP